MDFRDDFRGVHDLGGFIELPLEQSEHEYLPWEKRTHAIRELLAQKGMLRVDELRRAVEGMGEERYKRLSYYEQWIWAMSQIMIEHGVVTNDELATRISTVSDRVSHG